MSDYIIKGKGVYKRGADGVKTPQSFPDELAHTTYSDKMSHFHIDHATGKPHAEIPDNMRFWPMEAATRYLAEHMAKDKARYPGNIALNEAKKIMNQAAMDFNRIKRQNGDDFHTVPIPFGEDGQLNAEYKSNHYGQHESRRIPTSNRKTRDSKGRLINLYYNSVAHPTLGRFLESGAFHFEKEFRKILQSLGIESDLGARQNVIEPQVVARAPVRMGDGSIKLRSLLHRYHSNDKDPESRDNHVVPEFAQEQYNQQAQYGQIKPEDIIATLAQYPKFFETIQRGRPPNNIVNALLSQGVSRRRAEKMALAPVGQLVLGRGKKGASTKLNNLVSAVQNYIGIEGPRRDPTIADLYHKHRSHFEGRVGGANRGRTDAAKRILATLKTAQELDIDLTPVLGNVSPNTSIVDSWRSYATGRGGKVLDFEGMGIAQEHHQMHANINPSKEHLHDTIPNHISVGDMNPMEDMQQPPPIDPSIAAPTTQQPLATDPFGPEGTVATRNDGDDLMTSFDDPMSAIAIIMERVQMRDTWDDAQIMKRVNHVNLNPQNKDDMSLLAKHVGLETNDVRAIAMAYGDWTNLAQSFQVGRDVVEIIKASCVEVTA